ncbi:CaiB/BaiF CoA transferase family protein [Streptosporangium roseum]|uniref:Acyl-CoA transferase/carnitine dehydratase n=1 Tax=Streptosporangium roseum (strain ATCC 12428 / DSM 43021 / JCM 3005 / KCTC 9067 / NCIMB 10171 / NRRL 2505 / NI 9100) TaxID=479432 RepID=D2ASH3_STRRD|nr:CoA transferase [Streptosporangium roseum]ACZ88496.1 acyl-CoA transferase/carnitine dehydratase [Streptosporangium roseum DSM 43021]
MTGPLAGIRVADFSRVLAGPYATMILAELGADVVKVEHPEHGDDTRAWGPPYAGGEAAYYLAVNRGKRSVALDVKHPSGREIAQRLCADADVVIENFRPGVAERLGVGHESVRQANPGVVYCSIIGFPGGDRPGFDATIQAESGYMHITGETPSKVGVAITDVLAGLNAAVAILGALHRRATRGQGERVEVSLIGSALSGLVNVAQSALVSGEEALAYGNAHPTVVPYQTFEAADGRFVVAVGNDRLFRALCAAIGREDLGTDARFRTNAGRVRERDALIAELAAVFPTRPVDEWIALLGTAGVPAGKIRGVLDAIRTADGATLQVRHPTAGPLELVRTGFTLESVPADRDIVAPPLLGQHTHELLAELGVTDDRIALLQREGVIHQAVHQARPH